MLSRSSEYAIRALTYLTMHNGEERHHLVRNIAAELGIPAPFLAKVLQPLVARGILHSQRGRSGGFKLALPAQQVSLLQIVDTQERMGRTGQCLLGQSVCDDDHPCPMHAYWKQASAAFVAQLEDTTLSDLADFCRAHSDCKYPYQFFGEGVAADDAAAEIVNTESAGSTGHAHART